MSPSVVISASSDGRPDRRRTLRRAADGLVRGHALALDAVKSVHSQARVGLTHGMQEWTSNAAGRAPMRAVRRMFEDIYLEGAADDDFVGVQTYTRVPVRLPAPLAPAAYAMATVPALRRSVLPKVLRREFNGMTRHVPDDGLRRTQMGYEFRPQAIAATLRRAASLLPGKDLLVTEHGIATADDDERVEFIRGGLTAVHEVISEGLPVKGYLHWSLLDNFEWAHGYRPTFGLIAVDRDTMTRSPRPSLARLGDIARTGRLQAAR